MNRHPDPLDHLTDALAEDIVDAPAGRLVAEAAEDHGDGAALAAVFDRVAARAARQSGRRRIAGRIGALAAMLLPKGSWRPAMAAVAGIAVIAVAGDLYWHVRPGGDVQTAAFSPAAAPPADTPAALRQEQVAQDAIAAKPAPPPAQDRRADAASRTAQPAAAAPAPRPPVTAAPPPTADEPRRVKTVVIGGGAPPIHVAEAPLMVRPPVRDDRLRASLDYERARNYDRLARAASQSSAQGAAAFAPQPPPDPPPGAPPAGAPPSFDWPLHGRVLVRAPNEGIDVLVPAGTDVRAAADGVVIYAGGADRGFGNLILVSHGEGFVTVYGYASRILVKAADQVRRGQVIARSGASGEAAEPQLHFEIRKDAAPVDPARVLPPGGPPSSNSAR